MRWKVTIDLQFHITNRTDSKSSRRPRTRYQVHVYTLPKPANLQLLHGSESTWQNIGSLPAVGEAGAASILAVLWDLVTPEN